MRHLDTYPDVDPTTIGRNDGAFLYSDYYRAAPDRRRLATVLMAGILCYVSPDVAGGQFTLILTRVVADMLERKTVFSWAEGFLAQVYRDISLFCISSQNGFSSGFFLAMWAYEHIRVLRPRGLPCTRGKFERTQGAYMRWRWLDAHHKGARRSVLQIRYALDTLTLDQIIWRPFRGHVAWPEDGVHLTSFRRSTLRRHDFVEWLPFERIMRQHGVQQTMPHPTLEYQRIPGDGRPVVSWQPSPWVDDHNFCEAHEDDPGCTQDYSDWWSQEDTKALTAGQRTFQPEVVSRAEMEDMAQEREALQHLKKKLVADLETQTTKEGVGAVGGPSGSVDIDPHDAIRKNQIQISQLNTERYMLQTQLATRDEELAQERATVIARDAQIAILIIERDTFWRERDTRDNTIQELNS